MTNAQTLLTPFIPTVLAKLVKPIRTAMGFKDNVGITDISGPELYRIHFRIRLPNAVEFDACLIHPDLIASCWQESPKINFFFRRQPSDPDPLTDPNLKTTTSAIAALFQRAQRLHPNSADDLWEIQRQIQPYAQLDDSYYRRIFHGVMGASANLRLGFRCNQDCGLCWQGRKWPEAPSEYYFKWLKEIAASGVDAITFTGGEPLLHPKLPELLALARDLGMSTMLQTNAMLLKRTALRRSLKEAGLGRLFVSFHAAEAEISDRMTRAPRTHRLTVAGIEAALSDGFRVGLNAVVTQDNCHFLESHARFILERFVLPFPDNPVESVNYSRPQQYYDAQFWRENISPYDEIRPHLQAAVSLLDAHKVILDVTAGSCGLPACLLADRPDLIYLPQADHKGMADLKQASIPTTFACHLCQLNDRCQGPGHGYAEKYGDRGLLPFLEKPHISETFPLTLTTRPTSPDH